MSEYKKVRIFSPSCEQMKNKRTVNSPERELLVLSAAKMKATKARISLIIWSETKTYHEFKPYDNRSQKFGFYLAKICFLDDWICMLWQTSLFVLSTTVSECFHYSDS